ncbi:MAG: hypothetical protein AB1349_05940 [Elusimicrobiota bacterium]
MALPKDFEIVALEARLTSTVYGKYGKKNDKLEDFGLKSWKSRRQLIAVY